MLPHDVYAFLKRPVQENRTVPSGWLSSQSDAVSDESSLLESGCFVVRSGKIDFSFPFINELFAVYPKVSVSDAVRKTGFNLSETAPALADKYTLMFDQYLSIGSSPAETRQPGTPLTPEKKRELEANPFVGEFLSGRIRMTPDFMNAAAELWELSVDRILDIFMVDHRWFYLNGKVSVKQALTMAARKGHPVYYFGNTNFDACILRWKVADLNTIALKGFCRIRELLPSMSVPEKKQLCLWIEGLIHHPYNTFTRTEILKRIGVSKSVYYRYIREAAYGTAALKRQQRDDEAYVIIREAYDYKGFRKGSRQIYMLIPRLTGKKIGLKRIRRIMKAHGMTSGIRQPSPFRQAARTRSRTGIKPDLLRRRFRLHRPNEVRVTDVTYLDYGKGLRAYGSALMDPVTGRLITFHISEHNDLELALETLRQGDQYPCADGGIFHSDQGTLYQSGEFQKEVLERGLLQSMSKRGNCWDNATQESFFGHFKDECDYEDCKSIVELKKRIEDYSHYYNNERGLWDRGRMTPVEYEAYLGSLSEEDFQKYLAAEEEKYTRMKRRAAELARKRYGTLGVQGGDDND